MTSKLLAALVKRSQAIGADVQFLLAALVDQRSFADVRHKAPIGRILSMADGMTVHRALATNIASLCHFRRLPSKYSTDQCGQHHTTIV